MSILPRGERLGVAVSVGICLILAAPNASQDKDTMWSSVVAEGAAISIKWSKDHPWDAELSRGGLQLLGRYRADGPGDVTEVLSAATGNGGERIFRFKLPAEIRSRPLGPVCLFVQLAGRKVLPVRKPDKHDTDTAGFRHEGWEAQIRHRHDVRNAERRVADARRAVAVSAQSLSTQEATVLERGWTDPDSCSSLTASAADTRTPPYDVIAPAEHDDVARRVCVYRVWNGRVITETYLERAKAVLEKLAQVRDQTEARKRLWIFGDAFFLPEAVGPLLDDVIRDRGSERGKLAGREAQASEFRRDWDRLSPSMAVYEPHLGSANDVLSLASTAAEAAFLVFGPNVARNLGAGWALEGLRPVTMTDKEGVLGVALDAYSGCVDDGRKQLAIKWDNWQSLVAAAPRRAVAAQEFFSRECRQELQVLDSLRAEKLKMQEQLAREEKAMQTLLASFGKLPSGQQVLNGSTCGGAMTAGSLPPAKLPDK